MHRAQEQVRDFHRACNLPRPGSPIGLTSSESDLRIDLIREELVELADALLHDDRVGAVRELCDLIYQVYGTAVAMGIDLEPFFEEVHRANMEKAGGPKREDGKQLKPNGWVPPNLDDIYYPKQEMVQ